MAKKSAAVKRAEKDHKEAVKELEEAQDDLGVLNEEIAGFEAEISEIDEQMEEAARTGETKTPLRELSAKQRELIHRKQDAETDRIPLGAVVEARKKDAQAARSALEYAKAQELGDTLREKAEKAREHAEALTTVHEEVERLRNDLRTAYQVAGRFADMAGTTKRAVPRAGVILSEVFGRDTWWTERVAPLADGWPHVEGHLREEKARKKAEKEAKKEAEKAEKAKAAA